VQGGAVGAEATGVTWTRASAPPDESPVLPLRIGPLPAQEGRLQFKLLQTYSNGEIDRWIDDWPAGAAEPDMPGPVLDLVTGAAGDPPPPTAAPTTSAAPTTAAATTTTESTTVSTTATADADDDEDDGGVPVVPIALGALVVAGATAAVVVMRRRASP
jgi:hypothetical protein